MITFLRSLAFSILFYGLTVPLLAFGLIASFVGWPRVTSVAAWWSGLHRLCARWLLGQKIRIEGTLPDGPYLYIFKHESMFETIDLPTLLSSPAIFAKRELLDIPVWGRLGRRYGILPVERAAGASAMRAMRKAGREMAAKGRGICLFAEGTRVPHGSRPPLQAGFAGLYSLLGLPVVPVAVNSGLLSPRASFIKRAGTITYRVGETIPPGLDRKEAEARVHAAINALNG